MLYYTILYYTILYYAMLCYAILYHNILCTCTEEKLGESAQEFSSNYPITYIGKTTQHVLKEAAPRLFQMLPDAPRCSQMIPYASRCSQMLPETLMETLTWNSMLKRVPC